jgi:hypothetical protein
MGTRRRAQVRSIFLFGAIVASTVVFALAARSPANERPGLGSEIASVAATAGDGGYVDLSRVADFAWDRVHIFGAYSNGKDISDSLGFEWLPVPPIQQALLGDASILSSDELTLLVFVQGERDVTGWTILNEDLPAGVYVNFVFDVELVFTHKRGDAPFLVRDATGTLADRRLAGWLLSRH